MRWLKERNFKVYCGIFTQPTEHNLEKAKRNGIGILRVEKGKANVVLEAKRIGSREPSKLKSKRKLQVLEKLAKAKPGGIAGLPTLGNPREVAALAKKYQEENPEASWELMYKSVPNSYSNFDGFYYAMIRRGLLRTLAAEYAAARTRLHVRENPDSDWEEIYCKFRNYYRKNGVTITRRISEEVHRHRVHQYMKAGPSADWANTVYPRVAEEVHLHHVRQYLDARPKVDWEDLYFNAPNGYRKSSAHTLRKNNSKWCVFSTHPLVPDL